MKVAMSQPQQQQHLSTTAPVRAEFFLLSVLKKCISLLVWSLCVVLKYSFKFISYVFFTMMEATKYIPFVVIAVVTYISLSWEKVKRAAGSHWKSRQTKGIKSPYPHAMVQDCANLLEELAPSDQYIKEGTKAAQKIFEKLKQDGHKYNLKIARTKIAGSFKKGTGISYRLNGVIKNPDLDLIVVVNDEEPPFKKVFKSFKKILQNMPEIKSIDVRKYTVNIIISTPTQGDIEVDLLAANNLAKNNRDWIGKDIGNVEADLAFNNLSEEQIKEIRENQRIDQAKNKLFSSAFAEKTLEVIRLRVNDPFVKNIVLLAKYWNAMVEIPEPFAPARSCMIELIAIYTQRKAWRKEKRYGVKCVICGFRRFLHAMKNLKCMNISLETGIVNNMDETGVKKCERPMVRDPVNIYNNFAQGLEPVAIQTLVDQANKTLKMLARLEERSIDYEGFENAIDEVFRHKR